MTTIAFDGRTIAADGLSTAGDEPVAWDTMKLRLGPKCIYAFSGEGGALFEPTIEWWEKGRKPGDQPKPTDGERWCMVIVDASGCYTVTSHQPYPTRWNPPQAWGSGCDYALGAMHAGANAYQAVQVASRLNLKTGGTIVAWDVARTLGLQTETQAAE